MELDVLYSRTIVRVDPEVKELVRKLCRNMKEIHVGRLPVKDR